MSLLEAARSAAQRLRASPGAVDLWARPDADGVAACAVLARAFMRAGRNFHCRFEPTTAQSWSFEVESDVPAARLLLGPVAVPPGLPAAAHELRVGPAEEAPAAGASLNPLLLGQAPAGASTSTTTLALALAMDDRNWDQGPIALSGAFATRQHRAGLTGWNDQVHREAKRRGHLRDEVRINLEDAPLLDLLAYPPSHLRAVLPPGYDSAQEFLRAHRLPPEASPHELGVSDQQSLASGLALAHLKGGRPPQDVARLFAPQPLVERPEPMPLPHLATLVDAAARQGEAGLALGYLLGDTSCRLDLEAHVARFHERIRAALQATEADRVPGRDHVQLFRVDGIEILEPVADWAVRRVVDAGKTALAFIDVPPNVRLQAAASAGWVGAHLGQSISEVSAALGGRGHGQADRAFATIPSGRFEEFLNEFERRLAPAMVEAKP